MTTLNQLIRKKRSTKKVKLNKTPALTKSPQKYGTCLSVFTKTPRKPNSALRKVAKVRLANSKVVNVFIPGEGHNISRFSDVIITGRRIRDLPGIKYSALRGKLDLAGVSKKRQGRSKYGSKREKLKQESNKVSFNNRSLTSRIKKKYHKLLKKKINLLYQSNCNKFDPAILPFLRNTKLYNSIQKIKFLKSKKTFCLERNSDLVIMPKKKTSSKKKKIRKAWVETKYLISGIKKSISKKENLRRLANHSKKTSPDSTNFSHNHDKNFTLLEVSQTLRIIRVSDLENERILRYSF